MKTSDILIFGADDNGEGEKPTMSLPNPFRFAVRFLGWVLAFTLLRLAYRGITEGGGGDRYASCDSCGDYGGGHDPYSYRY